LNIGGHAVPVKRTFRLKWTILIKRPLRQQKKGDIPVRLVDREQSEEGENLKDGVRGSFHNGEDGGIELGGKECFMNPRGFQYSLEWGGR